MAQATGLPARSEIDPNDQWDLASVYPTDDAWGEAIAQLAADLGGLERFQGRLGESPATLAEFLAVRDELDTRLGYVYVYASLQHEGDTADQAAAARYDRARSLYSQALAALAFGTPEIVAIGFDRLREWTAEEPRLEIYTHYFDSLARRQEHVRSPEVEELLGSVADPFGAASDIHGILADADLTFRPAVDTEGREHEVAQGTVEDHLHGPDRALRRSAWESYADAHLAVRNTMASCLATGVKQHVFAARVRRYGSALEAALGDNDIPVAVFRNLIETYRRNLPTWHRYWAIRKRALGVDALAPYDIWAPLARSKPAVSFDRALEWTAEGLAPLGTEYVETVLRGVREERWVDKYPNRGKRAGAFSSGSQGTHPFILLNNADDLSGLSTLAHELGHSMHSYLTTHTQPFIYADYSIFAAEVASNFNQALVRDHLLKTNTDPDFQIAVLDEAFDNFHRYMFLMPALARFELELHERAERSDALTADAMMEVMTGLFAEGYGGEMELDEPRIGITWAQFPTHLYLNFYVYQYATGICGAHALARDVLAGDTAARDRYLGFLRAGSSVYPLDALREAGVDLERPEPVQAGFDVLAEMVDRVDRLVGERDGAA